jgi:aldose 1-epimerase
MKNVLRSAVWSVAAGLAVLCLVGCAGMSTKNGTITKSAFGALPDGRPVELYTLRNAHGAEVSIMTYGGRHDVVFR